jgi:hypothetical protein
MRINLPKRATISGFVQVNILTSSVVSLARWFIGSFSDRYTLSICIYLGVWNFLSAHTNENVVSVKVDT